MSRNEVGLTGGAMEVGRRVSRRAWILAGVCMVGMVGLVGATAWRRILAQSETRVRVLNQTGLDAIYATGGVVAIASLLTPATGTVVDALSVMDWIVRRNHVVLFGGLVAALGDPRAEVRQMALGAAYRLSLVDLKPYQATLDGFGLTEVDFRLRKRIKGLAERVRAA